MIGGGRRVAPGIHVYAPQPVSIDFDDEHETPQSAVDAMVERARARIGPRAEPADLAPIVASGGIVVDTRPAALRASDGELDGALVLERNVLEWRLDPTSAHRAPEMLHVDQPVVIVCDEGYASSLAAASLHDLGLTNVTDLRGGYQAWRQWTDSHADTLAREPA